jgi:hypothetical protein
MKIAFYRRKTRYPRSFRTTRLACLVLEKRRVGLRTRRSSRSPRSSGKRGAAEQHSSPRCIIHHKLEPEARRRNHNHRPCMSLQTMWAHDRPGTPHRRSTSGRVACESILRWQSHCEPTAVAIARSYKL